jgi:starch phosphorylase
VIPLYFDSDSPRQWIALAKASMRSIIPRFNAERMVRNTSKPCIVRRAPTSPSSRRAQTAETLAGWKRRILEQWPAVKIERIDAPSTSVADTVRFDLRAQLAELAHDDVRVECVVSQEDARAAPSMPPEAAARQAPGQATSVNSAAFCRLSDVSDPHVPVPRTAYPFEMGRMLWI